ncbi:hypothetical protein ACTXT7_009870 [Hymenolepis weldensis]
MESDSVLSLPSGWLYKWTNYLKGYRKRCHPNAVSHTCMGTIDLTNITISPKGSGNSFILREVRGRSYHLRALNEQDKRRWINVLTTAKSKLIQSHNGLESDSYSDDMNSYVRSRNSGKVSQNNTSGTSVTSSWRSFSRFRRKHRPTLTASSTTEEGASPDVTVSLRFGKRKSDPNSAMQSPLANGSRAAEVSSVKFTPPYTYSPQRRRCTLNAGLTSELRATREFQHQLNSVDSAFDNFVIQANHVVGSIRDVTISTTDKTKSNTSVLVAKLVNLQSTIDGLVEYIAIGGNVFSFDFKMIRLWRKAIDSKEKQIFRVRRWHRGQRTINAAVMRSFVEAEVMASMPIGAHSNTYVSLHSTKSISYDYILLVLCITLLNLHTCQKTMTAWTTSTEWFQRQLASEYDKSARLERTVEQLAKQHRALETQFYSSYASLSSGTTRPISPIPSINLMVPASPQPRDTTRRHF